MNILKLQKKIAPLLFPLGAGYAALMAARRKAYGLGLVYMYQPSCPCISIGNISWGGSGKTPVTEWFLDWAEIRGLKAAVLTRGYKGNTGGQPLLVEADTPALFSGDEPLMLAQRHPKARVLAFPRRSDSAQFAETAFSPDLFLLDDGMQHLGVQRHIEIVLLRPQDLDQEWNRVIPAGSWREGKSALSTASAFCIKVAPESFAALRPLAEKRLSSLGVPLFSFSLKPKGLVELGRGFSEGKPASYVSLPGDAAYILASAVGHPAQVEETVSAYLGRPPQAHVKYPDHHYFTEGDVLSLSALDLPVVCTMKDAVKFEPLLCHMERAHISRFLALDTAPVFGPALFTSKTFTQWWEERWNALRRHNGKK